MRRGARCGLGYRAGTLIALALCSACDFGLQDIALSGDTTLVRDGGGRRLQDGGQRADGPSDAAMPPAQDSSTPPPGQTGGNRGGPPATQAGASGGSPMGAVLPPLDAGPDAAGVAVIDPVIDPGIDPVIDPVIDPETDAGIDSGIVDPCADGSLRCVPVAIVVFGDWDARALPRATVVVTAGEHTFRGEGASGFVKLDLPIERELWLHVTVDGHLPTYVPRWIEAEGRVEVLVFSKEFVTGFLGDLQLDHDETTGIVLALVESAPPVIGAGMDLDKPHDGPFTGNGLMFVASNVLLPGGNNGLVFANVSPGAVTPSWISPPGYACAGLFDRGYTIAANTVLTIPIFCHEVEADAGPLD